MIASSSSSSSSSSSLIFYPRQIPVIHFPHLSLCYSHLLNFDMPITLSLFLLFSIFSGSLLSSFSRVPALRIKNQNCSCLRFFCHAAPSVWNSLPFGLRNSSLHSFTTHFKIHLFPLIHSFILISW